MYVPNYLLRADMLKGEKLNNLSTHYTPTVGHDSPLKSVQDSLLCWPNAGCKHRPFSKSCKRSSTCRLHHFLQR